jgi:hypothetical protein
VQSSGSVGAKLILSHGCTTDISGTGDNQHLNRITLVNKGFISYKPSNAGVYFLVGGELINDVTGGNTCYYTCELKHYFQVFNVTENGASVVYMSRSSSSIQNFFNNYGVVNIDVGSRTFRVNAPMNTFPSSSIKVHSGNFDLR